MARWILVAAMASFPMEGLEAQRPPARSGDQAGPARVDRAAAQALRLGDEIELTEAQRSELQALRGEALQALETLEQERLDLRQQLRAHRRAAEANPETTLDDLRALRVESRARMEALGVRERELTAPIQERYEGVLGAEQRLELRERGRSMRARAGNARGMRGRWNRGGEGGGGRDVTRRSRARSPRPGRGDGAGFGTPWA